MLFGEGVLGLALLGLWIYCLLDAITANTDQVRNLPKLLWVGIVVILPDVGSIAWLIAGRPRSVPRPGGLLNKSTTGHASPAPPRRAKRRAPDDDPEFMKSIADLDSEHEALLDKWEADLRRREEELKRRNAPPTPTDGPGDTPA